MSTEEHDQLRLLLGGYLLGGLDEADTDRLDAHLLDCAECRAELDKLAGVPELLRRLPDEARAGSVPDPAFGPAAVRMSARPSAERIEGLLARMRAEKARTRRMAQVRWLAAAAVVLVAAAVGFAVLTGRPDQDQTPQALPSAQLVTAHFEAAAGSGLSGEAVVTAKTWGVAIALDVNRLEGSGPFVCQVRDGHGLVQPAAMWGPTPSGSAKVNGASSIQVDDVSAISIADSSGHVLGTATMN